MPSTAGITAMPFRSLLANMGQMSQLFFQALANQRMPGAMLRLGDTLEIVDRVIVPIPVLVVNIVASRDRPERILPHMSMQKPAPRLGSVEISPMREAGAVWVAPVPMPSILDDFRLR